MRALSIQEVASPSPLLGPFGLGLGLGRGRGHASPADITYVHT
jgi:hypothetical protein